MRQFTLSLLVVCIAIQTALTTPPDEFTTSPDEFTRKSADFLPMAVWYGGGKARAPMLEPNPKEKRELWRKDIAQIKSLGFNTFRAWVDWATAEPIEGQFNFDHIDVLMDLAEEAGLKVMIQVYADSAPDWVGRKYPDSHFVSISGDVMPSESSPGFCWDHPGVGKALLGFYSAVAKRVKNRRAFYGWDLWSEPHVINWAQATYMTSPEFCFCPYTTARFRRWVQGKYGSLDALNRAWYRRFTTWDEVRPNRLSTILSYTDYTDWRFFILDKLAEDLRHRYEAVKRVAPDRLVTSHAAAPSLFTSPLTGYGSPDDWKMAAQVDYWGTSFYPKHSFPVGRDPAWRAALLDFSRSACYSQANGFYVGELQGGFGTVALRVSSTVTPEDVNLWAWSALARGAKGINFYAWYPMSSGYESGGFGLINLDGTITERARQAGRVAQVVGKHQELFLKARPAQAEVAIVYNPLSYMVGGRRPLTAAGAQGEFASIERNSMLGIYRALFPLNVPIDFIHINQIAEGKAEGYKLILLPYPLMVSESAAKALIEYVRQGGTLMTEARAAWNDDSGWAKEIIPGFGLHEVCACRETAVQQTPTGRTEMEIIGPHESVPLLQAGDKVRGSVYEETLTPTGQNATVIAKFPDGSPAIVVSSFGKGKMIAVGSFLGASYETERDTGTAKFLTGLLEWAGIAQPVEVSGEGALEVRVMESERTRLLFVINHSNTASAPSVKLKLPDGSYSSIDLVTGEPMSGRYREGGLNFTKQLAPYEVWVVRVNPG